MTARFAEYRETLDLNLTPAINNIQAQLDATGETKVTACNLLLEVAVKMTLAREGRSELVSALRKYADMVRDDLLTTSMAIDEMPELE